MNFRKTLLYFFLMGIMALHTVYAENAAENSSAAGTVSESAEKKISEAGDRPDAPPSVKEGSENGKGGKLSGELADEILKGVEKRYSGKGFIAYFKQMSTIKAMDITDTAEGKVFIKGPGMMRWEYEKPEKQIILTDGEELWIFKPADNQVMTGKAPSYFGDGKGGGILSDIRIVRDKFTVTAESHKDSDYYQLLLIPGEKKPDLTAVRLFITKKNYDIERIITYNAYEDETLIEMEHLQFDQNIDDSVFSFQIPEGADVVQLEE
ncbi:MAG: outer membrane lipoprotein carrier protein LolA [Desulfococcaceae bacterium]|nr:outer membrane lipoprotein carrier protein LolA [Desulfococcaceae bacterium]